jgi:sugar lactone lactonase YvrE
MSWTRHTKVSGILPEGPIWDHRLNRTLWVDILSGLVWNLSEHGQPEVLFRDDDYVSGIWLAEGNGYVVASGHGVLRLDAEGSILAKVDKVPAIRPNLRFNDGAVDHVGRLLLGTMGRSEPDFIEPYGSLICIDGRTSPKPLIIGLTISNGIDWSPDHEWLYVADTIRRRILILPYDDAVSASYPADADACESIALDGLPDGLCVRADGAIVVAMITDGHLLILSPEGKVVDRVAAPASCPTSCCFGGPKFEQLFLTTSTHLLPKGHAESEAGHLLSAQNVGLGKPSHEFRLG